MEQVNKQIVCLLGDNCEIIQQKLLNFEGGMHQFNIHLQVEYKQSQHQRCGVLKTSWLNKLQNHPSVIVFIYDLSDQSRLDTLLENYNQLKNMSVISKKFQPKLIILLTGKGVHSIDFGYLKKDIDFRKVIVVEMDNIGGILKRLKKMIFEDALSFYEELFNKYKLDSHKLQKNEQSDLKLIYEIKKHLISEVVGNAKRSLKHLMVAYDTVVYIANQRKEALYLPEEKALFESYELVLQAEEYREIADQLKFKILRNLELNEVITQFDAHYRTFKNLIQSSLMQVQEYLWRIRIFIKIVKTLEMRLPTVPSNVVFNYFQCVILNYLHLKQIPIKNPQQLQTEYSVILGENEFVGRFNYLIRKGEEIIEMRAEQKCLFYEQIILHRQTEALSVQNILFLFQLWEQYNEQQETNATIYMAYLKMIVLEDYSQRQQLSPKLLKFHLIDEFKHIIQLEINANQNPQKLIQLTAELVSIDQNYVQSLIQLAPQLDTPINLVIPMNDMVIIDNYNLKFNLNQQLLSCLHEGELFTRDLQMKIIITENTTLSSTLLIQKPIQLKLYGILSDKISIQLICEDVGLYNNGYEVDRLFIQRKDPPILTLHKTTAFIHEINEIPISLSYPTEITLLNHCLDPHRMIKFKDTDDDKKYCQQTIILVSDTLQYEKVLEFGLIDETQLYSVVFQFPFEYNILVKQLDSLYQNAQNRNRQTLSTFSKAAIQLQVKGDVNVLSSIFHSNLDLEFVNKNKLNVLFQTKDIALYDNFGTYQINYERNGHNYSVKLPVKNISVINLAFDIQIITPAECRTAIPFKLLIKIISKEPQQFFIHLKDETKKQFFVMGMVKQYQEIMGESEIAFNMFPIEIGRCNLPGVIIEIRKPNNPHQLVFDSSGMKSIYVMP